MDFKKAFDSLHRSSIWKILKLYGIPIKIINLIKLFYDKYECAVLLKGKFSEWFNVKTGVRQGCILSPILFLITIDWVLRQTCDRPRGIQWTLVKHLEDLDFADDLALISRTVGNLQIKTNRLVDYAQMTGLRINVPKTKTMHLSRPPSIPLKIKDEEIESVENFTYLGSIISPKDGAAKDITNRLNKAKAAFVMLRPVWISQQYSRTTKLRIFRSNVITTLLYGAECWRCTDSDMMRLERFQRKCLRYILRIWWPNVISNQN